MVSAVRWTSEEMGGEESERRLEHMLRVMILLQGVIQPPRGQLAITRDTWMITTRGMDASGIQWINSRYAAEDPLTHRILTCAPLTTNKESSSPKCQQCWGWEALASEWEKFSTVGKGVGRAQHQWDWHTSTEGPSRGSGSTNKQRIPPSDITSCIHPVERRA